MSQTQPEVGPTTVTAGISQNIGTELTMLDDNSSGHASVYGSSSAATTSLRSDNSAPNIVHNTPLVYNYKLDDFEQFSFELSCEEICIRMCRALRILPTTRLLFGISVYNADCQWVLPGEQLQWGKRYAFRMRFKVPDLFSQLKLLDPNSHDYLYYQMRFDMLHENIVEIRYPAKKDHVMGLAVVDMTIDVLEKKKTPEQIESDYKTYLPRKLVRTHRIFVRPKILHTFRNLIANPMPLDNLKWFYIKQIYDLAPKYLVEGFKATVENLPDEGLSSGGQTISASRAYSKSTLVTGSNTTLATTTTTLSNGHHHENNSGGSCDTNVTRTTTTTTASATSGGTLMRGHRGQLTAVSHVPVYVKLSLHDSPEPGLKIATFAEEEKLTWILVAKIEDIYALFVENDQWISLEINGFPKSYRMHFENMHELKSFISYLSGYTRLTKNWMANLCVTYEIPSLKELKYHRCHGPIGGSYSFAKIREKRNKCGSYLLRQCEKEYDVYYIDINTRSIGMRGCQTETFQLKHEDNKWILNYKGQLYAYDTPNDAAKSIPTDSHGDAADSVDDAAPTKQPNFRIQPSDYDKPPLLLICLPKNLKTIKTETELSETELQRRRAQIFDPKTDLQWYINSFKPCDNGKMCTYRADWIQQGSIKDVPVTLKVLRDETNLMEFMKLSNTWSLIASPQFIKMYGLTLSAPYTMVMEYSKYGPLNEFLISRSKDISMLCLYDVVYGLVRGMHYLHENGLIHSYIRCANLYVTKFDPLNNILVAKINDPGYPRPYRNDELAWIPREYHNNLQAAKTDLATQSWAFATTIWEIFSRGRPVGSMTSEQLRTNFTRYGCIMEPLDESLCPRAALEPLGQIMMDGWSDEPDKRFDNQEIVRHLHCIKNALQNNYADPDTYYPNGEPYEHNTSLNGQHNGSISNLTIPNNLTEPLLNTEFNVNGACVMNNDDIDNVAGMSSQLREQKPILLPAQMVSVLQIADGMLIYKEMDIIGAGHYGTVYRGLIRYNDPDRGHEQVAIKRLRTCSMKKLNEDFEREMKIMQALEHRNVVKFKYWIDYPISIIMEYFEYGSFIVYLTSGKPNLTNDKLLRFASDIAEGMNYLRSKEIIHRDLAARNILVDRDCVKISDFGLAQIADSDGYYVAQSVREIPIKWYSPESIKTMKFSFYSDVWSYGVTLFEMFSRGEVPFLSGGRELNQNEFLNRLESGERLPQPELCPDLVYDRIMQPCWHANPRSRPTFEELIVTIRNVISERRL